MVRPTPEQRSTQKQIPTSNCSPALLFFVPLGVLVIGLGFVVHILVGLGRAV